MPNTLPLPVRALFLPALLLSSCGGGGPRIDTEYALPPGVEWTGPDAGTVLSTGQPVTLEAWVDDRDTPQDELRVDFLVGARTACTAVVPDSDGTARCPTALGFGEDELVAEVVDPDGRSDSATTRVQLVEGLPPVVTFQAEHDEGPYLASEGVRVYVQVSDAEDPAAELALALSSDQDGALALPAPDAEGRSYAQLDLREGNHRLVLQVTDRAGQSTTAEIWAEVRTASTPTCTLSAPAEGSVVTAGTELRLAAEVDLLAGEERPVVSWDSDLDGRLAVAVVDAWGEAAMTIAGLRQGTHTLTLEAGAPANCTATATIVAGAPPTLGIDGPDEAQVGVPVDIQGTATDGEDAADALWIEVHDEAGELLGSARPAADGSFAVDVVFETAGSRRVTVTAIDTHEMRVAGALAVEVRP